MFFYPLQNKLSNLVLFLHTRKHENVSMWWGWGSGSQITVHDITLYSKTYVLQGVIAITKKMLGREFGLNLLIVIFPGWGKL